MATEVGALYYDLNIDDANLGKQLDSADAKVKTLGDHVSQQWQKSVDASKQFAIGVAAVGAAVVGFGVVSVKAFEESQNLIAQTNAVLKSTGGIAGVTATQVDKLSKALQNQTRFSDEDVRSAENLLLTFTNIGQDIFPQATETVLNMATALGEDTKSASIQLGKALQDPILGITALRRVGVNFTDAQKDVIQNLVDTGRSAEAQQMILRELTREFGGSAKAAGDTFAGSIDKLKNKFNDFQEVIGETIVKGLKPFIDNLLVWFDKMGGAQGLMDKLIDGFNKIKPLIPVIAGMIIGGLTPAFVSLAVSIASTLFYLTPFILAGGLLVLAWQKNKLLFFALAGAITGFAIGLGVILAPVLGAAIAGFFTLAVAVLAATWPFILIGTVIAAGAYLVITHWGPIKDWLINAWQLISDGAITAWNAITGAISTAISFIWAIVGPYFELQIAAWMTVWHVVDYVFQLIRGILIVFWDWFYGAIVRPYIALISEGIQTLVTVFQAVWNAIQPPLAAFVGYLVYSLTVAWSMIAGVWSGVAGWFGNVWAELTRGAQGAGSAIANAISGAFNSARGAIIATINSLIDKVNDIIGSVNTTAGKLPGVGKLGAIPHLATGGIIDKPTIALLGEAGREAVIPLKDMNKFGGGGTSINGDINIYDKTDADYLLRRLDRGQQAENFGITPA